MENETVREERLDTNVQWEDYRSSKQHVRPRNGVSGVRMWACLPNSHTEGNVDVMGMRRMAMARKKTFIFSIWGLLTPASPPSCRERRGHTVRRAMGRGHS